MAIRPRVGQVPQWRQACSCHPSRGHLAGADATGGALAITVGVTVFSDGGFSDASQSTFIALSGVTLLLAASFNGGATIAAMRSPLALTFGALGALCIASAAWTIGVPVTPVRWGLTIMSYGAVFVAAATFTRVLGPWPLAAGIAVLAAIEAILGVGALAMHALPDAESIGGVWRPGGTFEYPPALAVLEVGAIPILSYAMARESGFVAWASAASAMLAGAVLGLAESQLGVGLAVVFLAIMALTSRASGISRVTVAGTAVLLIVGALAGRALLYSAASTPRASHAQRTSNVLPTPPGTSEVRRTPPSRPRSDLLHGRAHEWEAALQTWLDRPLLGAGAGSYYEASLPYQGSAATLYAHDLPLELAAELGVLGLLLGVALYVACGWTICDDRRPHGADAPRRNRRGFSGLQSDRLDLAPRGPRGPMGGVRQRPGGLRTSHAPSALQSSFGSTTHCARGTGRDAAYF